MTLEHQHPVVANALALKPPPATAPPDTAAATVEAYADRLVRYAFRKLGNLDDAQDVVQEVFVRLFATESARGEVLSLAAYLYRSVANACLDVLRRRHRTAQRDEQLEQAASHNNTHLPPDLLEAADELRRIERLLARLPDEQAETVRLRVLDGLRVGEIADVMQCSEATTTSRLRYGLEKLRTLVAPGPGEGK